MIIVPDQQHPARNQPKKRWRHQMETFSALRAICAGNSPITGEFPAQRPVTRCFDVFFALHLNKRLSKQSWGWWYETPSCSLWRQCNEFRTDSVTNEVKLQLIPWRQLKTNFENRCVKWLIIIKGQVNYALINQLASHMYFKNWDIEPFSWNTWYKTFNCHKSWLVINKSTIFDQYLFSITFL